MTLGPGACGAALAAALVGLAPAPLLAQMSPSDLEAVEAYHVAILAVEARAPERGLEAAFLSLASVRELLTRSRDSRQTLLESLPDEELAQLRRNLPGAVVTRDEFVFVGPDPDYSVRLAEARGDAADRAFFAAFRATYPNAGWPAYLQQQTDAGGCTRFGTGSLVGTYRDWSAFQLRFPDRYVTAARQELARVGSELTQSTCACGDTASVVQEMDAFVLAFQASPLHARILERVQALRTGRSDIRTTCASG